MDSVVKPVIKSKTLAEIMLEKHNIENIDSHLGYDTEDRVGINQALNIPRSIPSNYPNTLRQSPIRIKRLGSCEPAPIGGGGPGKPVHNPTYHLNPSSDDSSVDSSSTTSSTTSAVLAEPLRRSTHVKSSNSIYNSIATQSKLIDTSIPRGGVRDNASDVRLDTVLESTAMRALSPTTATAVYNHTPSGTHSRSNIATAVDKVNHDIASTVLVGTSTVVSDDSKRHVKIEHKLVEAYTQLGHHDKHIIDTVFRDIVGRDLGVSYDNIASLDTAKRLLNEAVVLPLIVPEFFTGIREPWKGILLFGPPGTHS